MKDVDWLPTAVGRSVVVSEPASGVAVDKVGNVIDSRTVGTVVVVVLCSEAVGSVVAAISSCAEYSTSADVVRAIGVRRSEGKLNLRVNEGPENFLDPPNDSLDVGGIDVEMKYSAVVDCWSDRDVVDVIVEAVVVVVVDSEAFAFDVAVLLLENRSCWKPPTKPDVLNSGTGFPNDLNSLPGFTKIASTDGVDSTVLLGLNLPKDLFLPLLEG